jgi:TolA-binding protein
LRAERWCGWARQSTLCREYQGCCSLGAELNAQKTQRIAEMQKQIATLQSDIRELRKFMNTRTLMEQYPNAQISAVQTAD